MLKSKEINTMRLYFPDRMMESLGNPLFYPLTIVEAPMGYGKTTLIMEYLKRNQIRTHMLRVYNKSTDIFWRAFAAQVANVDEDCAKCVLSLGLPNDAITMYEILSRFSGIQLQSETVILIDDYHLLENSDLNTFFECLSESMPSHLHIILTARFTNFKRSEELALKACMKHITKETFEWNCDEISKYFSRCGISLKQEQGEYLYSTTEGWISAIKLLMLEYASKNHFSTVGSIFNLIETAVYLPLEKEKKEFLLSMCLFDSFTLPQAKYMCPDSSAVIILSDLIKNNIFVTYERSSKTYTVHRIFLDFLREELDKQTGRKIALYKNAADWFMTSEDYQKARDYYFLCEDFDGLLTALEKDTSIDYSASDKDILKRYIEVCPDNVKEHHHLAMLKIALPMFIHNEIILFNKICSELENSINKDTYLSQELQNKYFGELELIKGLAAFNNIHEMSLHYVRAWELLQGPTGIYCNKIHWNFGSPSILYLYHRESGMLMSNVEALKEGLPLYNALTGGHGTGGEFVMEGEYYFNTGDFESAEISLQKAVLAARTSDETNILLCTEFLQIRLDFIRGNYAAVLYRLSEMRATMADRKLYNYLHTVEICEGFVYTWIGNHQKIPVKLLEADPKTLRLGFPALGIYNILLGKAMLLRGEYYKLIGSDDYFNTIASVFQNIMGIIYNNIHISAAFFLILHHDEAIKRLKLALSAAVPDKIYMPFAENYDYIKPLLKELSSDAGYHEDIIEIVRLSDIFKSGKERITASSGSKNMKLTKREMEIARLASAGLSNSEIGDQLFISENTVKSALKSVYSKLSVNNRIKLKEYLTDIDQKSY